MDDGIFRKTSATILLALSIFTSLSLHALTNTELAKRQARSVHLWYDPIAKSAVRAKGTGMVTVTQTNSYYMILGWDCGYCGLQDSARYGKILIFSVWDPSNPYDFGADPNLVREEIRARVLFADEGVNVARFGGEGTGARTITDIGWQVGEPVTVMITAEPCGTNRTSYTCHVRKGAGGKIRKIATVSTLKNKYRAQGLVGLHSFVEDFWRNGHSATLARRAEFSNIATRGAGDAAWTYATKAYFSGDGTESGAVDAGRVGERAFFLQTGGSTSNATTKIFSAIP